MARGVRDRMVQSAIVLLAKRGYQATSFSEVLAGSTAPRGSIYHHFPEGKDQLIAAAIDVAGARAVALLDALDGADAVEIVDGFMAMWRAVLEHSGFSAGCSVLAVTVSADSPDLLTRAGAVFRAWRDRLAELLVAAGFEVADAAEFATALIAAGEGAVVLSRAEQSFAPFDAVHAHLRRSVAGHVPDH
jgi:TetR/AcrR family transcriptional repressor of lmrAB and yxaGH operons